jgi:GT2 family glycosyltransferase
MDSPHPPVASVIVVSRDRRETLVATLDSVECQVLGGTGRFEIVVVDDGSVDGTFEMLCERVRKAKDEGSAGLTAIQLTQPAGPGSARQIAATHAGGWALVFIDSDCVARTGWLKALVEPLKRPEVGACGGAEESNRQATLADRATHFVLTSFLTTGGVRGRAGWTAGRYRPRGFSMAVRRDVFDAVGGFRSGYYGEDIELSARIAREGYEMVHAADARVWHRRRTSPVAFAAQLFGMGRARARLSRRDRIHAELLYLLPAAAAIAGPTIVAAAGAAPSMRGAVALAAGAGFTYLGVVAVAAAVQLRDARAAVLAPAMFVIQVASYAAGFIWGMLGSIARTFSGGQAESATPDVAIREICRSPVALSPRPQA